MVDKNLLAHLLLNLSLGDCFSGIENSGRELGIDSGGNVVPRGAADGGPIAPLKGEKER